MPATSSDIRDRAESRKIVMCDSTGNLPMCFSCHRVVEEAGRLWTLCEEFEKTVGMQLLEGGFSRGERVADSGERLPENRHHRQYIAPHGLRMILPKKARGRRMNIAAGTS